MRLIINYPYTLEEVYMYYRTKWPDAVVVFSNGFYFETKERLIVARDLNFVPWAYVPLSIK